MPDYTENHAFQLWNQRDEPWEYNTDFSELDTKVPIRDTDANKANYNPKDGALFRATDTGALYQGDGVNWVKVDLSVDNLSVDNTFTVAGVRFWVSPTEPTEAAADDVWIETTQ